MPEYELIKVIGQGGMGSVYEGRSGDGKRVAIKMMNSKATMNPEFKELFYIEAAALKKMRHPSVVGIVDNPFSDEHGNMYLPMEYVDGETIEHHVEMAGPYTEFTAKDLMGKILDAMAYIHRMGCIHRDIKPSNIMVRPDGSICIIDFGIAKDMKTSTGKTIGRIIGTDGYMSPEQAKGDSIDYRTDIYSLGCLLHYMLTGSHAIKKRSNDYDTICSILNDEFPRAKTFNPHLSDQTQEAILKAVDKNMLRRFQTVMEFKSGLFRETVVDPNRVKVSVGRRECDITIPSDYISGHHLEIEYREERCTGSIHRYLLFTDSSTNGTSVDGKYLRHGSIKIPFSFENPSPLPNVWLAGRSEYLLDWDEVIQKLRDKGGRTVIMKEVVGDILPPTPPTPSVKEDKLGIGYGILSVVCPIVGWVLWAQWKKETPRRARAAAICGWIGFVVGFIINILSSI